LPPTTRRRRWRSGRTRSACRSTTPSRSRRGYKQHRHDLCGSILKINQVYEPLGDNPPSGYRELLIARDDVAVPKPMIDPDGNRVVLMLTSGVIAGITET